MTEVRQMALNVTSRQIKHRWTDAVLWEGPATDTRDAAQQAVAGGADLRSANLTDANLTGANLRGAKNAPPAYLPTGESWDTYLREVVPALLMAGGKTLESFAPHWTCHTWDNCPMAHAFDGHDLTDVPMLLRPRAEQFVQLYDAGLIPWPLPVADGTTPSGVK